MAITYEAILVHTSIAPRRTLKAALVDIIQYSKPDDLHYGRGIGIVIRHFYVPEGAENEMSRWSFNKAEFKSLSEIAADGSFSA